MNGSMFYVYILQSTNKSKYYIGVSNDVDRRLAEHNSGRSKSTAPYAPFVLVRVERFLDVGDAYRRERELKSKKSSKIIKKIVEGSPDVAVHRESRIPIQQS